MSERKLVFREVQDRLDWLAIIEKGLVISPQAPWGTLVQLADYVILAAQDRTQETAPEPEPTLSNWKAYPADWPPTYNASGTPCDMLVGACSCGASHVAGELQKPVEPFADTDPPSTPDRGPNGELRR